MLKNKYVLMSNDPGAAGGGVPPAPPAPAPNAQPSPAPGPAAPAPSGDVVVVNAGDDASKTTWPEDWRTQLAGEKEDKQLTRFSGPKDVYHAWKSLQQRLSSGELKSQLPKDAKPEDLTKWRAENGIPEAHDGYKMPDGLVIGEVDKPLIDVFLKDMHGKNATPDVVQTAVQSYYKIQEQAIAQQAERDIDHKTEMEDALRSEWGAEYRGNVNAINSMFDGAPGGIKEKIMSARMADGRAILNDPDVLRWFATTSRELNPAATVVPPGGDQMGAINDEIGKIEKLMGNRSSEYWKGPGADKMQARYRELVSARDRKST
jgi:hypothetical protein